MSTVELSHRGITGQQESAAATMRRIGHVAGVVTIAIVIFASLYFFLLYIAAE
jgi:hypothetical protein